MKVTQLAEFLGTVYQEVVGESDVVREDLTNIVDVGRTLLSSDYVDSYVKCYLNRIGRMKFVDRPYKGFAPSLVREAWEWGSILSKSRTKDFTAVKNAAWDLTPGQSVDQYIYTPPTVQQTLLNEMTPWEIDCSFTRKQLEQSFISADEYDRFKGMIDTQIQNTKEQEIENMTMRVINATIGRRLYKNIAVVDLLTLYNTKFNQSLTPQAAILSKEFARFAAYEIMLYKDRIKLKTAAFSENEPGYTTFTPPEYLHLVLLSDFAMALDVYLQSDTYHNSFTEIGSYETVPMWQGSGAGSDFAIADISNINIQLPRLTPAAIVDRNYVVGVMFDRDACGIINERMETASTYNERGRYYNNFYQVETRLFTDPAENCIVFVLGSGSGTVPEISLNKSTLTVLTGSTGSLTATAKPNTLTVTWTSSDEDVATVSSGTVTGVAPGTATIIASVTQDGITRKANCVVTVRDAVTPTIELDKSSTSVAVDATTTLTATATPDQAVVTWASSSDAVATVAAGVVTGKSSGSATITATATNDGQTATDTCTVTVTS